MKLTSLLPKNFVYCEMRLLEELKAEGIDPDKYIALQNEFILYCHRLDELNSMLTGYREFIEKDQFLTKVERLINRLERERLQEKIRDISNPSSA